MKVKLELTDEQVQSILENCNQNNDCPYCHLDENLTCSQEWFNNADGTLSIGICCGDGEVNVIVKQGGLSANLVTQAKYCPYCGRQISL